MARWTPEKDVPGLYGKVAIVTGGNAGIGFYTAKILAQHNAQVIIASRNEQKGQAAANAIKKEFSYARVEFMKLDLASRDSILSFVDDFREKSLPLHILVNNAGVCNVPFSRTKENYEVTVGTNHFGTFLLTTSLLDILKASSPARVVTVSSVLANSGKVDFHDLAGVRYKQSNMTVYSNSKLYNVLFGFALERRLRGTGVHSHVVHPGVAKSDIFNKMDRNATKTLFRTLAGIMAQSTDRGAHSSIFAATSPSLIDEGGLFLGPTLVNSGNTGRRKLSNKTAYDISIQDRLWTETERILAV
eukprot:Plantae.Rhodophyta-Purpureofilum_apyrenoidigerum.ctg15296.p1 GENE.Plantae.Rhodophyta-Purpureofilum_apyrenoidigerum.ctg15296~~Plantae.Rhodophyta-Purpureofilum_apyrenoidigerum.ctg15296.p1  ORF type:complete len:302 (+),score=58.07 Plantae.Rhodophyta-Purpureofilum_apyrenoidigerum.ctg15296:102-1007(+)